MTLRTLVHLINYPYRHLAKYVLKILSSVTVTTNSFVEKTQNNLYISLKIQKQKEDHLPNLDIKRLYKHPNRLNPVHRTNGHGVRERRRRIMISAIDAKTESITMLAAGVEDE